MRKIQEGKKKKSKALASTLSWYIHGQQEGDPRSRLEQGTAES